MQTFRLSAFSHNNQGGNPAGVVISDSLLPEKEMQTIAKEINYSETAFLCLEQNNNHNRFVIRYYSPVAEVNFCGHATIASGAVLGQVYGNGNYTLLTKVGEVPIEVNQNDSHQYLCTLTSVNTKQHHIDENTLQHYLDCFNLKHQDLDTHFKPMITYAGAYHLVLPLATHQKLQQMNYDFDRLNKKMQLDNLTTINLIYKHNNTLYYCRNAFPVGGVIEDPATGAAAAAFAGYLRDQGYSQETEIQILQGFEIKHPSEINIRIPQTVHQGIRISGQIREIV